MLKKFGMINCKPRSVLLLVGISLSSNDRLDTEKGKEEMKRVLYQEAPGSLIWLQVVTRLDLSFAVNLLSCFATNPERAYWKAMKHTMAYVKGTTEYGIAYHHRSNLQPVGFTDSDFANDKDI